MRTIVIALDAGHGLKTPGKRTPNGIQEWLLNDAVRDEVVNHCKGYLVTFIHLDNNEGNVDESLSSRVDRYLKSGQKIDAVISIHHNAFTGQWNTATGVEVYTDKNPTAEDERLAQCVYDRMVKYTGLKGRGIKRANFTVINQNSVPAILVEGGFMDSTKDYDYITSKEGQKAYAKAVAEGLIEFCNLQKKTVEPKVEPQKDNKPKENPVLNWQKAAVKDGFKFPKYGTDGKWGSECVSVAKKAICKKRVTYKYKNLTKIVQKAVGVTADGKFGKATHMAVVAYQKKNGLTADGCVGLNTWKQILNVK